MRKSDRLGCWKQLLTLVGIRSLSEKQWADLYKNYLRSWNRVYYLKFDDENDLPAADDVIVRRNVTTPPGRHRYPMAPPSAISASAIKRRNSMALSSAPSVSAIKRRNSQASPSAPSVNCIKRRNTPAPSSANLLTPIKRRNTVAAPSAPSFTPIKRRNSLAPSPTAAPTMSSYAKGQDCDPVFQTVKRNNSVAADNFDTINHTDQWLSPIKRSDSVINEIEIFDCDGHDSMALREWMKPNKLISPLAPSPRRLDTDLEMNLKDSVSVFPMTPSRIKRRDSSIAAQPSAKSKSKPRNIVKMATGSDEDLEDEMPLSTLKKYNAQRKRPLGSLANGFPPPKLEKEIKVEQPVKRKRGRPSREEKAKRLEEEKALKMKCQTTEPIKKLTSDETMPDLQQQVRAPKSHDARKKQQKRRKTTSQSTINLPHQLTQFHTYAKSPNQKPTAKPPNKKPKTKPPNKKPTAKPRCQSSSSVADQDGAILSNVVVQPAILDEDAIAPAHMPADAIDLKTPSKKSPKHKAGEKEDKKEEEEDEVLLGKYKRSIYNRISSDEDEDEQHLILEETGFVFNDLEAEEQLLDDAMNLTSPVGGEEGDALEIDFDIDLLVRDDNVANQIALIDSQPDMSFDQCLETLPSETQESPRRALSETLESPKRTVEDQLTHTSEFFEKLPSRPPLDVSADKSNLLWPFMDEEEVLDYEADYDVLSLVVSSDELEDECPSMSKGESKPSESSQDVNQTNLPKVQAEPPKPEEQPKPSDKHQIPASENFTNFRIPSSQDVNQTNLPKVQAEPPKPEEPPKPSDKPQIPASENFTNFRIPRLAPELLKSQPSVMQSLYIKEAREQQRAEIKAVPPPVAEDVNKRREEARAARRPKETMPRFAPPYRPAREDPVAKDLSQPIVGPQDLAPTPLFGPEDLAPIFVPPSIEHPGEASPLYPEAFLPNANKEIPPEVPAQQHPPGASQYVPQNLVTAEMLPRSHQGFGAKHWIIEIFGAKCLNNFGNKCLAADCDHAMSPVGEVERRLLSMTEDDLVRTYRQALRSFYIFERYFKCFANIFERRKLHKHLLQMLANSRLYRNITVPIVRHVFQALKVAGLEREATQCLMTNLWMPDKAHKFRELMLILLQILGAGNWQDYIDQLVELHETYKFLLSEEFMIRIMKWADVTKNEALQKKSLIMLLADMTKYARSQTLMALVAKFSNPETKSNRQQTSAESIAALPLKSLAQQQQQYPQSTWNLNTNPNQVPNLIPHHDRLPGAASSSNRSLIGISAASGQPLQYPASIWNLNPQPNQNMPGAVPGSSPIRSNPAITPHWSHNPGPKPFRELPVAGPGPSLVRNGQLPGQHQQQQQQQYPTSILRSQAADDNTFRNYPCGYR